METESTATNDDEADPEDENEMLIFPLNLEDVHLKELHLGDHCESTSVLLKLRKAQVQQQNAPTIRSPSHKKLTHKWRTAASRLLSMEDPWSEFHIQQEPSQQCQRHRYSAIRRKWISDSVTVKMMPESFARGAMRECFRLKKMGAFQKDGDWDKAANYVAKRYINPVDRQVYFEDVRLQMDAKLWSEEYNRHNPPKKVDIFQVSILEFPNDELYHLEHYIEGDYVKYNSNSGFVDSDAGRQTPHAFSHFTFERSGHQLIVVDIQGVGDLYTDPQIHTVDGKGYGDGNLGTKGMSLFFKTHVCNSICHSMDLTQFDLAPTEKAAGRISEKRLISTSETVCKGSVESCFSPPAKFASDHVMDYIRMRSMSSTDTNLSDDAASPLSESIGNAADENCSPVHCRKVQFRLSNSSARMDSLSVEDHEDFNGGYSSQDTMSKSQEAEKEAFWLEKRKQSRPSCYAGELQLRELEQLKEVRNAGSILGQIHLDFVRYYVSGRFSEPGCDEYDRAAAWFHLEIAANCIVREAVVAMAKICLGLPQDLLPDFTFDEVDQDNIDRGLEMMQIAAENGDRSSMLFLAQAYESGTNLGSERTRSVERALHYYEMAWESIEDDENGEFDATADYPKYLILAKIAELYHNGDDDFTKDCSKAGEFYNLAAEAAVEAMKGKLANNYYALAEQVYGEIEE